MRGDAHEDLFAIINMIERTNRKDGNYMDISSM